MSSFGVLSTGFNPKLIGDILADIEAQQKTDFGPSINTGAEAVLGQLNATFAAAVAEAWEVLQAVYSSIYPSGATGAALDNICEITGVTRLPATHSQATVTCSGTSGALLLAGRVVSVDATGERFVSVADATIGSGGTVDVLFESENFGPIVWQTAQTATIETPVPGWAGISLSADAELGEDLETDAALRLRRSDLLRAQGAATLEAIRADLLAVDGVNQAFVYENVSLVTDGRSLPPKSIECIVQGGVKQDVLDAIFLSKAAGIETYGHPPTDETGTVTDSQGINHTINFTRPDEQPIYIELTVKYDPSIYDDPGDDQLVKDALINLGNTLGVGDTIVYERFQAEVFTVPGVRDCSVFKIDTVSPPTGTSNLFFSERELATFQSADIDVTSEVF